MACWPLVVTKRAFFAGLRPSMMSMARLTCAGNVCLSRTARFLEYYQIARQWLLWWSGSQTGSRLDFTRWGSGVAAATGDGVDNLPIGEDGAAPMEVLG